MRRFLLLLSLALLAAGARGGRSRRGVDLAGRRPGPARVLVRSRASVRGGRASRDRHRRRSRVEPSSRRPAGVVTFAGTVPGNGKSLTILTSDGWSVTLTQLGSIAVAKGATVAEGDARRDDRPERRRRGCAARTCSSASATPTRIRATSIRRRCFRRGLRPPAGPIDDRRRGCSRPRRSSVPTSTTPVDGASVTTDPAAVGAASRRGARHSRWSARRLVAGSAAGGRPRQPAVGGSDRRTAAPAPAATSRLRSSRSARTRPVAVRLHRLRSLLAPSCRSPSTAPTSTVAARPAPAPSRSALAPPPDSTAEAATPSHVVVAHPRAASRRPPSGLRVRRP